METEDLVEALYRTIAKLHVEGQLRDPSGYAWAEQEHGEDALGQWLENAPDSELSTAVRALLERCERSRQ